MESFVVGCAVAFGLIVGSFLNVVIHRLPRAMDLVWVRSQCPACGKLIAWYDNIPVVSFLFLLARCRHCRGRISWRYPLVELLTAVLFGLAMHRALTLSQAAGLFEGLSDSPGGFSAGVAWTAAGFVFMAAFLGALVASTFIDLDHRILPDEITKSGMWIVPVASLIYPWIVLSHFVPGTLGLHNISPHAGGLIGSLLGMVGGAGMVWMVAVVGKWIFRKDAMGFGDVKFMGMIGGFLGPVPVLMVFFIGCVAGSVVGLTVFALTRNRYMAFGPYLALGGAVMLLFGNEALWVATTWWPEFVLRITGSG
jgi:leader peptidase (prepilin peptidase) / N-methyltransferase